MCKDNHREKHILGSDGPSFLDQPEDTDPARRQRLTWEQLVTPTRWLEPRSHR